MKKGKIVRRFLVYGLMLIIFASLLAGCSNTLSGTYYHFDDDGNTDAYLQFASDNSVIIDIGSDAENGSYEMNGNTITLRVDGESVECILSNERKELTVKFAYGDAVFVLGN